MTTPLLASRLRCAAGLLLGCGLAAQAAAQPPDAEVASHPPATRAYLVDRWGVEEGLTINALTSVIQTRDGYLWVGTWVGILRFDGVRFTPVAEELPNVHARALLEDPDGSVWIAASGTGVVRWRPDRFDTFARADGLAGDTLKELALDAAGRLWVGTETGLSMMDVSGPATDAPRIATWRRAEGLPADVVTGLAPGAAGQMWIATEGGFCEAIDLTLRCVETPASVGPPTAILETTPGHLLIGTRRIGLFEATPDGALTPACGGCLTDHDVSVLRKAREGGVWIGFGWGGGVALLRDGVLTRYGEAEGLPTLPVVSLYEDPEGSLWVATDNGGLARLRPKRVTTYSTADGLPAKVVSSIVQDASGTIWAGTRCAPVSALRNGRFEPRFAEYTRDACTYSLLATRDGSLWIGTQGRGLFRWDGRRMHRFDRANGLSDAFVPALFEDRDGVLWIGTEGSGRGCNRPAAPAPRHA